MYDVLYCDGCIWLSPTEEEQDNLNKPKPSHRCTRDKQKLLHGGFHPHILRPANCQYSYQKLGGI